MKNIRFSLNVNLSPTTPDASPEVRYGILDGGAVQDAAGGSHALSAVRLLPPCSPTKIACVGRNYRAHAAELGNEAPGEPIIFLKPPSSLIAHGDAIVYPELSKRVDHEGELGVVIGRRTRNVRPEEVEEYIAGYTCVNDVTARDLQKTDAQWTRAKGFDTFCAVGPWMLPRAEFDPATSGVRTFVDGEKRQEAPFTDMIFSIGEIISYISRFMTLEPGDLVATGTPSGVGPMQRGSVVRVEIDGLGVLENRVE